MIYSITSPVGIDVPIKNLQRFLYDGLISLWGLSEIQVRSFPRGYKQEGVKFFSTDYVLDADGLLDDKFALQFFFLESRQRVFDTEFRVPVDIYFSVNLKTVKPSITWRADEEVKQDIFNIVRSGNENFVQFDSFDLEGFDERMDLHPYHSFKVTTNLIYRYDKTI